MDVIKIKILPCSCHKTQELWQQKERHTTIPRKKQKFPGKEDELQIKKLYQYQEKIYLVRQSLNIMELIKAPLDAVRGKKSY